jgi:hypothetical protein
LASVKGDVLSNLRDLSAANSPAEPRLSKFEEINRKIHLRKGIKIGNPALIIQHGYWKPTLISDDKWREEIANFIKYLAATLRTMTFEGCEFKPSNSTERLISDITTLKLTSYRMKIDYGSYCVKFSVDIFMEYWSYKIIFDYFSTRDFKFNLDDTLEIAENSYNIIRSLGEKIFTMEDIFHHRYIKRTNPPSDWIISKFSRIFKKDELATRAEVKVDDIIKILSDEISDLVDKFIELLNLKQDSAKLLINDQNMFASFFGFCLGLDVNSDSLDSCKFVNNKDMSIQDHIRPKNIFTHDNTHHAIEAIWPMVKHLNPYVKRSQETKPEMGVEIYSQSREITISDVSEGRAIYISSLGGVRASPASSAYYPLSYILLFPHKSRWQIGRIAEKIHLMGLYRLASLYYFNDITDLSDELESLIQDLDSDRKVENISDRFRIIRKGGNSGLLHKVEWTLYYIKVLNSMIDQIRFSRVIGFQTYPEFVRRRIEPQLMLIDKTRQRFDYLLFQINNNIQISSTAGIKKLLSFAEIASIFPIPYYLYHVIGEINELAINSIGRIFSVNWEYGWLLISIIYVSFIGYRIYPEIRNLIVNDNK